MDVVLEFGNQNAGSAPPALEEHSCVRILISTAERGHVIPAGCIGTIVHIYNGGEAYEVEFYDGDYWLATMEANDVEPFEGSA